jgi:hypothetical protein
MRQPHRAAEFVAQRATVYRHFAAGIGGAVHTGIDDRPLLSDHVTVVRYAACFAVL